MSMKISNPDKIVFPKQKITKQDVADYYAMVSNMMLPYIENRALSLVRCPSGVEKDCHYRKNPDTNSDSDVVLVSTKEELLRQVQMNTIEFHIYGSPINSPEKPDIMVFDLDPDEKLSLAKLRQGVRDLKSILDDLNLISFLKTSGGKGYHVVVPFSKTSSWEMFSAFASNVAQLMEAKWPTRYTTNIRKNAREGKIFVDWLRNSRGATSVAPYSLRAKEGSTISTPISWTELNKISPDGVTMANFTKRLTNDPWGEFFIVKAKQKLG